MTHFTQEQKDIVQGLQCYQNISVLACAGSGKTTTIIQAAHEYHVNTKKKCILIAFNTMLQQEVRQRTKTLYGSNGPFSICATAHAFAHNFFRLGDGTKLMDENGNDIVCKDDTILCDLLNTKCLTANPVISNSTDVIILDEAQDCNLFMIKLFTRTYTTLTLANGYPPKTMLVGDPRQMIYAFRGANTKYLADPDRYIFKSIATALGQPIPKCKRFHLTRSFRQRNRKLVQYIRKNSNLAKIKNTYPDAYAFHDHNQVYSKCNAMNWSEESKDMLDVKEYDFSLFKRNRKVDNSFFRAVVNHVRSLGFRAGDILHLARSVRNNQSQVIRLNNELNKYYPLEVRSSHMKAFGTSYSDDHLLCTTIHGSKGLQRECVILHTLSYADETCEMIQQSKKTITDPYNPFILDNLMHVGLTRARSHLVVIQDSTSLYTAFKNTIRVPKKKLRFSVRPHDVSVVTLVQGVDPSDYSMRYCTWSEEEVLVADADTPVLCANQLKESKSMKSVQNLSMAIGVALEYMIEESYGIVKKSSVTHAGISYDVDKYVEAVRSFLSRNQARLGHLDVQYFLTTRNKPDLLSWEKHLVRACMYLAGHAVHRSKFQKQLWYVNEQWIRQTKDAIQDLVTRHQSRLDIILDSARNLIHSVSIHTGEAMTKIQSKQSLKHRGSVDPREHGYNHDAVIDYTIYGQLDFLINGKYPIEIKFSQSTLDQYKQQTAMYALLCLYDSCVTDNNSVMAFLCNANTGSLHKMTVTYINKQPDLHEHLFGKLVASQFFGINAPRISKQNVCSQISSQLCSEGTT